jgi:hypothetical protein
MQTLTASREIREGEATQAALAQSRTARGSTTQVADIWIYAK